MSSALALLSAQDTAVGRVRAWRAQHEPQILRELFDLVAIPNVASNTADVERNAQALTRMFEKRRFLPETIPAGGAPLVVAERRVPNARRTVTFYFHYDGQPVDRREWTHAPPFSPNLEAAVRAHADRVLGDALILVDGPRHASDRPTLSFGARGIMTAIITVYGPARDLHSGNYGNWAPNPALDLARLLASMKQADGRVTIDGFYDDVVPLTATERQAIDDIPNVEATLMQAYGFTRRENAAERLELRHNQPTINVNAIEAGGGVGGQGRTIIPGSASAKIDVRLVKAIDPSKQFDRIVAHIRRQGYFVVETEPDAAMRTAHPMIARVTRHGGYPAGRTSMETPLAASVAKALSDAAGGPLVRLPTIGGSTPFYLFADVLGVPTFGLSIVNFDNNQHGPNENLRIKNLWEGIDSMAALLTMR